MTRKGTQTNASPPVARATRIHYAHAHHPAPFPSATSDIPNSAIAVHVRTCVIVWRRCVRRRCSWLRSPSRGLGRWQGVNQVPAAHETRPQRA
jgi:hypothetical protein